MKDKVDRVSIEEPEASSSGFDDITAPCDACGEENVGVGTPVMMVIPGMIFNNVEYDVPMFVPDPDVKLRIVQLPNGAIGFVTDQEKTKYNHEDCYTKLVDEVAYLTDGPGDEDDESEEEEEEEEND